MLKFKKIFVLGLLFAAAVSMFAVSCSDSGGSSGGEDDPKTYTVTVRGGTAAKTFYKAGDLVTVTANDSSAAGRVFDYWVAPSIVIFADDEAATTTFTMPAADVTVTAMFMNIGGQREYTVTVVGGLLIDNDWEYAGTTGVYEAGYIVWAEADDAPAGKEFSHWTASHVSVEFDDEYDELVYFIMPPRNVTITAVFVDSEKSTGDTYVAFAWPASQIANMYYVYANDADISFWYDEFWWSDVIDVDDFVYRKHIEESLMKESIGGIKSGVPTLFQHLGMSADVRDNRYNGEDFKVAPGSYIAVASIDDNENPDIAWDIIADYALRKGYDDGEDYHFELVFNLKNWVEGGWAVNDNYGWYACDSDGQNGFDFNNCPALPKRKPGSKGGVFKQKIEKGNASMDVTVYVLPRAKKK